MEEKLKFSKGHCYSFSNDDQNLAKFDLETWDIEFAMGHGFSLET